MRQLVARNAIKVLAMCAVPLLAATHSSPADACGCLSPPIPPPMPQEVNFAVNQQAEQIIFEVEEDHVTAHVLIRYQGDPESFGWLVPVPTVPELDLSFASAFGVIDQQTQPSVQVAQENICPSQVYVCKQHPWPTCPTLTDTNTNFVAPGMANFGDTSAPVPTTAGDPSAPSVMVYARQQIGSYDTVVLGSGDALAINTWLNDNGFIVNATMAPYMQPYLDMNMLFVAARLVPGAGVDEIRPLKMRYEGTVPMIPLQLTAVAAEPHLTVTAYIYGNTTFQPLGKPLAEMDASQLARDATGRVNYPMLLNRTVDEAGGDAFVREFSGSPPRYDLDATGCCTGAIGGGFAPVATPVDPTTPDGGVPDGLLEVPDVCGIGGDGQCQCPQSAFDYADCQANEELTGSIQLVEGLADKYTTLTRLTTRLSAEEMTFDPMFEPASERLTMGRLSLAGNVASLAACEPDVMDVDLREAQRDMAECATLYCGKGECVTVSGGVACTCDEGYAARTFTDSDGGKSVTCVPDTPAVDLSLDITVPDVCEPFGGLENGTCLDNGGFPAVSCDAGYAAVVSDTDLPECASIVDRSGSAGAFDNSDELRDLDVCAPAPPRCSAFGWLERLETVAIAGVECPSSIPDPSWLTVPREPTCSDLNATVSTADTASERPQAAEVSAFSPGLNTTSSRPFVKGNGCAYAAVPHGTGRAAWLLVLGALGWVLRRRRTV